MMPLTIEGATVGYDNEGVARLLARIRSDQIDAAITHMNQNLESLTTTVDEVWQGHSAEIFKQNVQTDVKEITEALDATHRALESELNQIVSKMSDVDQNLINSR